MQLAKISVIAGGGSGGARTHSDSQGYHAGGAGGAGGYIYNASYTLPAGTYSVTVGSGGTKVTADDTNGNAGGNSVFNDQTAIGGGRGAGLEYTTGGNGGSGGGGSQTGSEPGGTGTVGQGNTGGTGNDGAGYGGGGAGAGSSASGQSAGSGTANSISGSSVTYCVGGVGGGGGPGFQTSGTTYGSSGGGKNRDDGDYSGNAGGVNGVVIIRYATAQFGSCTGGTITTSGTDTIHTFTSSGTFIVTLLAPFLFFLD